MMPLNTQRPHLQNYVFWQNQPAHFQSPWLAALAAKPGVGVWVALESDLPGWRRNMGFTMPDYGRAHLAVGINRDDSVRVMSEAGPDAVHIFSGIGAYKTVDMAFVAQLRKRGRIGIMTECPWRSGLRGLGARLRGWVQCARFSKRVDFVLGMGDHAGIWYRGVGYRGARVFDFAYYPGLSEPEGSLVREVREGLRIVFVGQLVPRKGVSRLFEALEPLAASNWSLRVVGTGASEEDLKSRAQTRLPGHVQFCGPLLNAAAMQEVAVADLLVLPSLFDGYGAVVNEALLRGVPAICSSECGARQAVAGNPAAGAVFATVPQLTAALAGAMRRGPLLPERIRDLRNWAAAALSPESGADYFLRIMDHVYRNTPRPVAPWASPSISAVEENRK